MWEYTDTVKEHFTNPKNVGEIENADAVGVAGSLQCGDQLKLYLKIDNGIIVDAKFQTFGCGSAVAASSMLTEMVKGKTIEEAKTITNKQIADMLGGLPAQKMHCSVMGREALDAAIKNYEGVEVVEDKMVCHCYDVHLSDIKKAVLEGAKTMAELSEKTGAGMGCRKCKDAVQQLLNEELNSAQ